MVMKSTLLIVNCVLLIVQINYVAPLSVTDLIEDLTKELEEQFGLANDTLGEDDDTMGKFCNVALTFF